MALFSTVEHVVVHYSSAVKDGQRLVSDYHLSHTLQSDQRHDCLLFICHKRVEHVDLLLHSVLFFFHCLEISDIFTGNCKECFYSFKFTRVNPA